MKYTLAFIFTPEMDAVILQKKNRGLYPGLWNGVGGHIEDTDPDEESAALRKIKEETGLGPDDVDKLTFLVKLILPNDVEISVFYTKMKPHAKEQQIEDEILCKFKIHPSILDAGNHTLAGDGNIPYFIQYALNVERQQSK